MQTSHIPRHSTKRTGELARHRVERWLQRRMKQGTCILASASACYIQLLPRSCWDRIVLFIFVCCLTTFLRALGGFGLIGLGDAPRALNHTLMHPSTPPDTPLMSQRETDASSSKGWVDVTRVVVGWQGEYELFPSTTSISISPPSIPQDAFPDPTPMLYGKEHGSSLSTTSGINAAVDFSATFHGVPYDPFRLDFEGFDEGGDNLGLYPVMRPPSTARQGARQRRFGRCIKGEDCM